MQRTQPSALVPIVLSASCGAACALNSWHLVLMPLPSPSEDLFSGYSFCMKHSIPLHTLSPCIYTTCFLGYLFLYTINTLIGGVYNYHQTQPLKIRILFSPIFFWLRIWGQLKQADPTQGLLRGCTHAASQASGIWSNRIPLRAPSHGEW